MPSINTKIYYLHTGHFLDTGRLVIVSWVMIADVILTSCKSGVGVPVSSAGDRTKSARRSWFKASWASFSATCVLSSITASMDGRLVIGWIQWKYGKSMKLAYCKCSKPWAGGLRSGCHCMILDDFSSDHSIGCWMMCHTLNPMAWHAYVKNCSNSFQCHYIHFPTHYKQIARQNQVKNNFIALWHTGSKSKPLRNRKSRITCHNEKTHEKTCYEILFNVVHRWNNLWHFEANTKW